jgi:uncharacterized iron-regulated membrane protein
MRSLWLQVHLWLGLTLGVVGALLGVSGCILVYDHEIDAWLHTARYAVGGSGNALALADYARIAERAVGEKARAGMIRLPDRTIGPVVVFVRGNGGFQRIYIDPADGDVLDRADGRDLVAWMHNFHESLMLREYRGRELVGVVGIAMLVSSLSGIYLWWPAGRLRRETFGFRRGFAFHRNLHYTVGFWGALVLAMLSFTGIFLGFAEGGRSVVAAFGKVSPSPRGFLSAAGEGGPISVDEAAAIARAQYPGSQVTSAGLPAGPRGVYRIGLRSDSEANARQGPTVFIDPRTRDILHRVDPATRGAGDTFLVWQRILHEGSAGGEAGRLVTFLGGLMPPVLMVTGLLIWIRKRRARRSVHVPTVARDERLAR